MNMRSGLQSSEPRSQGQSPYSPHFMFDFTACNSLCMFLHCQSKQRPDGQVDDEMRDCKESHRVIA